MGIGEWKRTESKESESYMRKQALSLLSTTDATSSSASFFVYDVIMKLIIELTVV